MADWCGSRNLEKSIFSTPGAYYENRLVVADWGGKSLQVGFKSLGGTSYIYLTSAQEARLLEVLTVRAERAEAQL